MVFLWELKQWEKPESHQEQKEWLRHYKCQDMQRDRVSLCMSVWSAHGLTRHGVTVEVVSDSLL